MVDEITYPFLNFNVYEWISNFIPHNSGYVIIYVSKRGWLLD